MGSIYKRKWKDKNGTVHESETWSIKYYKDGKPFYESAETTKETDAKKLLKKREGDVVNDVPVSPRFARITIDELLADLETEYSVNDRRSLPDLKGRIRLHIKPYFKGRRAASITTTQIRQFVQERKNAGASNGEINRELSAIKRAFSLAVKDQRLVHRPHVPMLAEADARAGFFERAEFESVSKHLPKHVRPAIQFAYITGWRIKSEVLTLKWNQVDFDGGAVRLDPGMAKNRRPREFPFTKKLRALLESQGKQADTLVERGLVVEHVFFNPKTGQRVKDFRKAWRNACLAAGLATSEQIGTTKKKHQPILRITPLRIPHDFRRTAVRNLVRAGIPERVAMQMTGHKTRAVFDRYNITSGTDLKEAAEKLDKAAETATVTVTVTVAPKVSSREK